MHSALTGSHGSLLKREIESREILYAKRPPASNLTGLWKDIIPEQLFYAKCAQHKYGMCVFVLDHNNELAAAARPSRNSGCIICGWKKGDAIEMASLCAQWAAAWRNIQRYWYINSDLKRCNLNEECFLIKQQREHNYVSISIRMCARKCWAQY